MIGFSLSSPNTQTIAEGDVPDFTAQTLNGETISLTDYRGQVVMLNFWATWCPPCRAEMPSIEAAYEPYLGFMSFSISTEIDTLPAVIKIIDKR